MQHACFQVPGLNILRKRVSYDGVWVQAEVFEEVSQLVQSALDGYKVCIFAYGQTGSGKVGAHACSNEHY